MVSPSTPSRWVVAVICTAAAVSSGISFAQLSSQVNNGHSSARDTARTGGIWKAVVPPKQMKGEFDSLDPLGVAAGTRIKADCSLNWINPDDGRLYCFASGTSLVYFLDQPHANIDHARKGWLKLTSKRN